MAGFGTSSYAIETNRLPLPPIGRIQCVRVCPNVPVSKDLQDLSDEMLMSIFRTFQKHLNTAPFQKVEQFATKAVVEIQDQSQTSAFALRNSRRELRKWNPFCTSGAWAPNNVYHTIMFIIVYHSWKKTIWAFKEIVRKSTEITSWVPSWLFSKSCLLLGNPEPFRVANNLREERS